MITLEKYKNYLINYCESICDDTELRRGWRREALEEKYSDEYLQKVVDGSFAFLEDIFSSETLSEDYCEFSLDENTTEVISLNLIGGVFSDTLFTVSDKTISKHILKEIFGEKFDLYVAADPYIYIEDYLLKHGCDYFLYMYGFPNYMDDIKRQYLPDNKKIIKK